MLKSKNCNQRLARSLRKKRNRLIKVQAKRSQAEVKRLRFRLQRDLRGFVRYFWSVLEPATRLKWNWHLDLLCDYLMLVAQGKCRRLIINVPPRSMKSLLCTVFYPVWRWITAPQQRFMFVSYSEHLSTDHSLARRNVLSSEYFRRCWGHRVRLVRDQNQKTQYENTQRGVMFATSITGSATGKGCDVLIVDDPLSTKDAYSDKERETTNRNFDATFRSRLNDPMTGSIVIVMQRLHEDDLTGHLLAREPGAWTHVKLAAEAEVPEVWTFPVSDRRPVERRPGDLLWPEQFPREALADFKRGLGSWAYAGQYQQNPAPFEGGIIKRDWIKYYRDLPQGHGTWIQSWDCSFKDARDSDYVVGQVWVKFEAHYYLVDQVRERMDFVRTRPAIQQMTLRYPQATAKLIEDKANGPAVIQSLRDHVSGIIPRTPKDSKAGRLHSAAPLFEAGNILLPERAAWVGDFVQELLHFPNAAHDDTVDACTQALAYLHRPLSGIQQYYKEEAEKARKLGANQ